MSLLYACRATEPGMVAWIGALVIDWKQVGYSHAEHRCRYPDCFNHGGLTVEDLGIKDMNPKDVKVM